MYLFIFTGGFAAASSRSYAYSSALSGTRVVDSAWRIDTKQIPASRTVGVQP